MAVVTEARDRAVRTVVLGTGGLALGGVIFWLLTAADTRAKAERARHRLPDDDFPSP